MNSVPAACSPAYIPQNFPEPSNAESGTGSRSNSPPEFEFSSLIEMCSLSYKSGDNRIASA